MDSRRNIPLAYDEHSRTMHRGPSPPMRHHMEPLPPELLEDKMASQAAEIEQLTSDNRKLAASYMNLRQDLAAAKDEAEKIREHTRSIQHEGDIQIRILLDKIAKNDSDAKVGDTIKKELQAAHAEARSLMTAKLEMSVQVEQATKELGYLRGDIEKIPEMRSELDSLRQEYERLRKTFEYEKCMNVEKVEQLKILEKDLIGIAQEVERLRGNVSLLNAEKRAPVSLSTPYMNLENGYPLPYHGNGGHTDSYSRPYYHTVHGEAVVMMNPYASGGFPDGPQVVGGPVGAAGVGATWGGICNSSPAIENQVMSAPVTVSSAAGNDVCEEVNETSTPQV